MVADRAPDAEAGWYQPNNGDQRAYGYQNNLLIYRGAGTQTIRLDNSGHNPVDFTHNSWYPNDVFQWPEGRYGNLGGASRGLPATTPVFSGATRRHQNDNITVSNPWTTTIKLGSNYLTKVNEAYTPILAAGTTPKNSGTVIPNITDGFSGAAPDRGAIIEGRSIPVYGDRSNNSSAPASGLATSPSDTQPSSASMTRDAPGLQTTSSPVVVSVGNAGNPLSGTSTLLVDFGATPAGNRFALPGWSTVIKDVYIDSVNIRPGGTAIVIGDNYSYNYQGVTGSPHSFASGEAIVVIWYNNSANSITFTPKISFTDPDRITFGVVGIWYDMNLTTVPPFGNGTSKYTFTTTTAGFYSIVNVNSNFANTSVLIADKIELVPER